MAGMEAKEAELLSAFEAERLVEDLKPFPLREIGTPKWMAQHEALEKLNMQAHRNAQANSDAFVMDAMLTFDKMGVIVHELLAIEAWKEFVYPRMKAHLAETAPSRTYFVMYHEATLVNLLEVFMYYDYATQAIGEALVDLVDYCSRKVLYLINTPRDAPEVDRKKSAKEIAEEMKDSKAYAAKDMERQEKTLSFGIAVVAVCVLRYLTEHVSKLPLGVMGRLLDTHDIMLSIVPLIENPPWTRKVDSKWLKFKEQKWVEVEPIDLLKLTVYEGQAWLILFNLMMDTECRKKYRFQSHRKSTILRVRKYLNDVLIDQLPVLSEVQRYMDELTIVEAPAPTSVAASSLVLEVVPAVRERIVKEAGKWEEVIEYQMKHAFVGGDAELEALKKLGGLYQMDNLEDLMGPAKCYECGLPATQRCSRCKNAWYCGRECQVKGWKAHKKLCDVVVAPAPGAKGKKGGVSVVSAK